MLYWGLLGVTLGEPTLGGPTIGVILGVAATLPHCHGRSRAKFYLGPRGHTATMQKL